MASAMRSSTSEMVERKVLEMAQHASFHQHVSYNLSTILHAFAAGKTDPTEIAEAFSRARGLEVINRVISGEPLAKPAVVSLCCRTAVWVVDKFGSGISQSQAGGLIAALVRRLELGISGDDAQTVECQVECARLMSSVAGQDASLLIDGGALGAMERMLEKLGGKHSAPGGRGKGKRPRARAVGHVRTPSFPCPALGPRYTPSWGRGDRRSILRPCCEAVERVSQTEDGRATLEERGTGGVLLATIRDFPEALEEGSDAALASAMKVVERIFTGKTPEACARSLRAKSGEESSDDLHLPTSNDYDSCVETVLAVAEATPEAPGAAAATCLWWLSGASSKAADRALSAMLANAEAACGTEAEDNDEAAAQPLTSANVWSWFPRTEGCQEGEGNEVTPSVRPVEGARFLAGLCLCKPGIQCLEAAVERESPQRVAQALVRLCGSADPLLARACFRIIERLSKGGTGPQIFVDAGALAAAAEAGKRFEVEADAETVEDSEAHAIAAALGTVATLAEAGGKDAQPLVDEMFQLSVRCLGRVGEFSGRPAAAAAKSALDIITIRLTRPDRPTGGAGGATTAAPEADGAAGAVGDTAEGDVDNNQSASVALESKGADSAANDVDKPMEVLKDAGAILAVMKAHATDARVQQSGWRSLIAMDTGRGDVDKFWTGVGDGLQNRRQIMRDCLERHGGDSLVAGQVADILEGLVLQGDSDGEGSSLTASLSDAAGDESPRLPTYTEEAEADADDDSREGDVNNSGGDEGLPRDGGPLDAAEHAGGEIPEDIAPEAEQLASASTDEGGPQATVGEEGEVLAVKEAESGVGDEITPAEPSDVVARDGDDPPSRAEEGGEILLPEDGLEILSLMGTKALEGGLSSSSDSPRAGSTAMSRPTVARSLFGFSGHYNNGSSRGAVDGAEETKQSAAMAEADSKTIDKLEESEGDRSPVVVVPSKEELQLHDSWTRLERLHTEIVGRSKILGGESAQMVAAMPEPSVLKERVGTLLEEAGGSDARDAFAAASLALVGALTVATGALANSQKEVQRYLAMSRDLRETSTWKDISEAMQWTMDSLKGTVILFTPHTAGGLTRAIGLCKNMDSASKLFKEAALQIKIIVVELSGEHEPNTVWRVNPMDFENLPENRKIMMLRHLRSLVVAYDHLSDEIRRDLTTALEIIKNREVLNMMGKYCVLSEAAEEKRRVAKLASAEERLKVGRRSSVSRENITPVKRHPLTSIRASITEPSPPSTSTSKGAPSPSPPPPLSSTPSRSNGVAPSPSSSSGGNNTGVNGNNTGVNGNNTGVNGKAPPSFVSAGSYSSSTSSGRKVPLSTPRPAWSPGTGDKNNANNTNTASPLGVVGVGGSSSSRIPRGVASHSRRRDPGASAAARAGVGVSAIRDRRSKSPVSTRRPTGRSKSPVASRDGSRRASKSPVASRDCSRRASKSPVASRDGSRRASRSPAPSSMKLG